METLLKIVYGLIALGILVVVHELGHFLLARYYKVKVEIFSLGWGPAILKIKKGETSYQLGAIPFGGFCKMAGEEPSDKLTGAKDELYSKPPSQRLGIIFAGPFFNYIFGVLIFTVIFAVGVEKPTFKNQILVMDSIYKEIISPLKTAGLKNGDNILRINGKDTPDWRSIKKILIKEQDKNEKQLIVKRNVFFFFSRVISLKIRSITNPYTGELLINTYNKMTNSNKVYVAEMMSKPVPSPAKLTGLKDHDKIINVNGKDTPNWAKVREVIGLPSQKKERILKISRDNKIVEIKVTPILDPNTGASQIGILPDTLAFATTKIKDMQKDWPAQKSGLLKDDEIIQIDNMPIKTFSDLKTYVSQKPDKLISVKIKRNNKILSFNLKPKAIEGKGYIGIEPYIEHDVFNLKSKNLASAVYDGFKEANQKIMVTIRGLKLMIAGEINFKKAASGPIGIVYVIGDLTESGGFIAFLELMAIISILLGFFNLLPIPAVDGSYILIFLFEMITRRKLNYKVIQMVQYISFLALIGLLILISYNDVVKLMDKSFLKDAISTIGS